MWRIITVVAMVSVLGGTVSGADASRSRQPPQSDWPSLSPQATVALAARLAKDGAATEDRQALATVIMDRFLSDEEAIRSLSPRQWKVLVGSFAGLPEAADWTVLVLRAFSDDPQREELELVTAATPPAIIADAAEWMTPRMLCTLARQLQRAGDDAKDTHELVVGHLRSAIEHADTVNSLDPKTYVLALRQVSAIDKGAAAEAAARWVELATADTWAEAHYSDVLALEATAHSLEQGRRKAIMAAVDAALEQSEIPSRLCCRVAEARAKSGEHGAGAAWARRAYDTAMADPESREKLELVDLVLICEALEHTRQIGQTHSYPEAGEVVARLAREGKLRERPWTYMAVPALLLSSHAAIEPVRAELLDPDGRPRLAVAKMLAWGYRRMFDGSIDEWCTHVHQQMNQAVGDDRAMWTIAAIYADRTNRVREPVFDEKAMLEAIETTAIVSLRTQIVVEMAEYYAAIRRHDDALHLLEVGADAIAATGGAAGSEIQAAHDLVLKNKNEYEEACIKEFNRLIAEMGRLAENAPTDRARESFLAWQQRFQWRLDELLARRGDAEEEGR